MLPRKFFGMNLRSILCTLASGISTVVEYSPQHLKVQGSSPAAAAVIRRKKMFV